MELFSGSRIWELHIWGEADDLVESFFDIKTLAANCKFSDYQHKTKLGCAVIGAVDDGVSNSERLASYHKLKDELVKLQQKR